MKKSTKIIITILLVCFSCLLMLSCKEDYDLKSVQKDPEAQVIQSFKKTSDALEKASILPIPDTVEKAVKSGSVVLDLDVQEAGFGLNGTLYVRDESFAMTGAVDAAGESIEYSLWASEAGAAIRLPLLLGEEAYGFRPDHLREDLKNSPLLEMLGVSYEEVVKILDEMVKPQEENDKDLLGVLEMKRKLDTLLESCAVTVTEDKVQEIPVYRVDYVMTTQQICDALDIVLDWAVSADAFQMAGDPSMEQELKAEIAELKEQVKESNAAAVASVCLHTKSQLIVQAGIQLDWKMDGEACGVTAELFLGENLVDSTLYKATITAKTQDGEETMSIEYHRTLGDKGSRKLTVNMDGETKDILEISYDKNAGTFSIDVMKEMHDPIFQLDVMEKLHLEGRIEKADKAWTIHLSVPGVVSGSVTFNEKADAPAMPQFKNIFTMTEDELAALLQTLPMFGSAAPAA